MYHVMISWLIVAWAWKITVLRSELKKTATCQQNLKDITSAKNVHKLWNHIIFPSTTNNVCLPQQKHSPLQVKLPMGSLMPACFGYLTTPASSQSFQQIFTQPRILSILIYDNTGPEEVGKDHAHKMSLCRFELAKSIIMTYRYYQGCN